MNYGKEISECYRIDPIVIKNRPGIINAKVSVIIPVKNGIATLPDLIRSIYGQKRISDIEIIVIDSESSDNSDRIAEQLGARVLKISAKDFNHGLTRNLGASHARGDFLIFTVQDALPKSPYTFYNLLLPFFSYPNLGAISGRQFVREEADYYSKWINNGLYSEEYQDRISYMTKKPYEIHLKGLDIATKIRLSFLDNVFSAVRREVFENLKFREVEHGEDRAFALGLLGKGYALGFMRSTGVYHWHERGPEYTLKRNFVGLTCFQEIFNWEDPHSIFTENVTFERLIGTANFLMGKIEMFFELSKKYRFKTMEELGQYFKEFSFYLANQDYLNESKSADTRAIILSNIPKTVTGKDYVEPTCLKLLINTMLEHLESFQKIFNLSDLKQDNFLGKLSKGIINLFAHITGKIVAYYFLVQKKHNGKLAKEHELWNRILKEGV